MGDCVEQSKDNLPREQTYTEVFENLCPFFMSIGVSYDDFWNGEPEICKYALKAEKLRRKRVNEEQWWNSVYFFRALVDASPSFRDFGEGKTKIEYSLRYPLPMTKKEVEEIEERKQKEEMEKWKLMMHDWTIRHNNKIQEKKQED